MNRTACCMPPLMGTGDRHGFHVREGDTCKVEYLCVDTAIQSRGLGRQLLEALEGAAGSRVPPISVWMPGSQPSTSMSGPGIILWGKSSC